MNAAKTCLIASGSRVVYEAPSRSTVVEEISPLGGSVLLSLDAASPAGFTRFIQRGVAQGDEPVDSEDYWRAVYTLVDLEYLEVDRRVSLEQLSNIERLSRLRWLDLSDHRDANRAVFDLPNTVNISHLDLSGVAVTPAVYEAIATRFPKLNKLTIGLPNGNPESIQQLRKCRDLELMAMTSSARVNYHDRLELSNWSSLKELYLANLVTIGDFQVDEMPELQKLASWSLGQYASHRADVGRLSIKRVPRLSQLDLIAREITIESAPELSELRLWFCDSLRLIDVKHIRSIQLSSSSCGHTFFQNTARLPDLTDVSLDGDASVTDETLALLSRQFNIKHLDLRTRSTHAVTPNGVAFLAVLPLETLTLPSYLESEQTAAVLQRISTLRQVEFSRP
jgi:hypothetical protein